MKWIKLLFITLMINGVLYASEDIPTQEEVSKLYVATFNRAADSAGLKYWVVESKLKLSGIAKSFFDQIETQALYPPGTSSQSFINSVYQNLFNRSPDSLGLEYWEKELDSGSISRNRFIEAVINGAKDDSNGLDRTTLDNKNEVGLYFANAGYDDKVLAVSIMSQITSTRSTVDDALKKLNADGGCLNTEKLVNNQCVKKTCENDDYHCPTCLVDESLVFDEEGSGTCAIKIETVSDEATIEATKSAGAFEVVATGSNSVENKEFVVEASKTVAQSKIGKPMFSNGEFMGIVDKVTTNASGKTVVQVRDAENVADVYDTMDIKFYNDDIVKSIKKSLRSRTNLGKYDHLNVNKLKFSISNKMVTTEQFDEVTKTYKEVTKEEPVLRIDIPKGYKMPFEPRMVEKFSGSLGYDYSTQYSFGDSVDKFGLTFSTEGSYIEFGLGAYASLYYDFNLIYADECAFELRGSAYFESNLVFEISGELSSDWDTTLELTSGFNVIIEHPYSAIASVAVYIKPDVAVGVSGEIKGSVKVRSYSKRTGTTSLKYDTRTSGGLVKSAPITNNATNLSENGINIEIDAEANAYVYPYVGMSPNIVFVRILPLKMGFIRSGVRLDNNLEGHIDTGFTVTQEESGGSLNASASFKTELFPYIDYKLSVKLRDWVVYKDDSYAKLYKGPILTILDWDIKLLDTPEIKAEDTSDDSKKEVSFDISESDSSIKSKIKYYYTINGTDIPFLTPTSATLYSGPFEVDLGTTIKVRAMLLNSDVSSGIFSFGKSISLQGTLEIENGLPIADAGSDDSAGEGDFVTLDGSGSSDPDGTIESYVWTEGGAVLSRDESFTIDSLPLGEHTITLTVKDNDDNEASDSVVITIEDLTYSWDRSYWDTCSEQGVQTRTVDCTDSTGTIVDDSSCEQPKPEDTQNCAPDPSLCLSTAGQGTTTPMKYTVRTANPTGGTFRLEYETYTVPDEMIIKYPVAGSLQTWSSGVVGTQGWATRTVNYSGGDTAYVIVRPSSSGTAWLFKLYDSCVVDSEVLGDSYFLHEGEDYILIE